jgi:hypothetical protein
VGKKSLIPMPGGSSFRADVAAAVQSLLDNSNVKGLDVSVDKVRRTARFRAVGQDGRASTTDILSPGLVATVTSVPGTKKAFERQVTALFEQGYSQTDSGRILDCSQAHISKTQRRLGLR